MSWDDFVLRTFFIVGGLGLFGWVVFFGRGLFPKTWDEPLFVVAASLILFKLGGLLLLFSVNVLVAFARWLRPNVAVSTKSL
jgi:hypothetical protein